MYCSRLLGLPIFYFVILQEGSKVVKATDIKENIYKVYENKRLLTDFLETLKDVYSSTECLMTCERYQNCQSMNYNALLKQCELLNVTGIDACTGRTTEMEDTEGWMHYVITIKKPTVVVPIVIPVLQDCLALYEAGFKVSGVYNITIGEVYCDQTTYGGGWTVIQRRVNGSTDFYRNWNQYKNGFGNPLHELWLGNDNIYYLTMSKSSLFINMTAASTNIKDWVQYESFGVGNEYTKYRLYVSGFTGTTVEGFKRYDGKKFSTFDQDNDESPKNCAELCIGSWWYNACCLESNLNGNYSSHSFTWRFRSQLSFVETKVRRNV